MSKLQIYALYCTVLVLASVALLQVVSPMPWDKVIADAAVMSAVFAVVPLFSRLKIQK